MQPRRLTFWAVSPSDSRRLLVRTNSFNGLTRHNSNELIRLNSDDDKDVESKPDVTSLVVKADFLGLTQRISEFDETSLGTPRKSPAARKVRSDLVQLLNAPTAAGNLPLHEGMKMVAVLQKPTFKLDVLFYKNLFDSLQLLLERGADPIIVDVRQKNALEACLDNLPSTDVTYPSFSEKYNSMLRENTPLPAQLTSLCVAYTLPSIPDELTRLLIDSLKLLKQYRVELTDKHFTQLAERGFDFVVKELRADASRLKLGSGS
jgi:hypothetical protein